MNLYLSAAVLLVLGLFACDRRWLWLVPLMAGVAWAAEGLRRDAYSDSGHALEFSALLVAYAMLPFVVGWLLRVVADLLMRPRTWHEPDESVQSDDWLGR